MMNDKIKAFEEECHMIGALISGHGADKSVVAAIITKDLARAMKPALDNCETFDDDMTDIFEGIHDYDNIFDMDAALENVADKLASLPGFDRSDILDSLVVVSACAKNDKSYLAAFNLTNPFFKCIKSAFSTPAELIAYMDDDERRERRREQSKQAGLTGETVVMNTKSLNDKYIIMYPTLTQDKYYLAWMMSKEYFDKANKEMLSDLCLLSEAISDVAVAGTDYRSFEEPIEQLVVSSILTVCIMKDVPDKEFKDAIMDIAAIRINGSLGTAELSMECRQRTANMAKAYCNAFDTSEDFLDFLRNK